MSDEQFRKLMNKIDEVRAEASDKGHIFIIILLILIFSFK